MKTRKKIFLCFILCGMIWTLQGQNKISSPYSRFGLGNLEPICNGFSRAMGGVAYTQQNSAAINFANPASYVAFDSLSFTADVVGSVVFGTLTNAQTSQKSTLGRLDYLSIGFPLLKVWRTSFGILPYSFTGYAIYDKKTNSLTGAYTHLYEGNGGLKKLYWGNGFKIYKNLSAGLNISYLFGSLDQIKSVEFEETGFLNSRMIASNSINGLLFDAGLQYFFDIKNTHRIGFGAVYTNAAHVWVTQKNEYLNYTGTELNAAIRDTIPLEKENKTSLTFPQSAGGGISYQFKDKLLAGVDFTWQDWSSFALGGIGDSLRDNFITSLGIQYTINPNASKYVQKINWRLGFKYETGYLLLRETAVSGFSISAGLGLPFRRTKSTLNFFLEYGERGKASLIRENYFKVGFQFILHEKWYRQQKLN